MSKNILKNYKLAVFDIDGVLNEHGGNILPESIEAIKILKDNGIQVCFASGKHAMYIFGGLVFAGLKDDETIIIGENGGTILYPTSKKTFYSVNSIDKIKQLKREFYSYCEHKDGYTYFKGKAIWEEPKETLFTIFPKNIIDFPIQELSNEINDILIKLGFKNELYISEHVDAIDVITKGINKTSGLKLLCNFENIRPNEIIGFGDDFNDFEMLEFVGFPVAVQNAREKIKEMVKKRNGYVCNNHCGKGVLEAVKMLI